MSILGKIIRRSNGLFRRSNETKKLKQKIKEQSEKLREYAVRINKTRAELLEAKRLCSALAKQNNILVQTGNEYASLSPGNKILEEKWKSSPGKRILFWAPRDYSGSLMKWAMAVHTYTPYAVRLLAFSVHRYGYDVDLVFPAEEVFGLNKVMQLFREADVIHLKDETYLFSGLYGTKKINAIKEESEKLSNKYSVYSKFMTHVMADEEIKKKPKIFTHYGGYARKFKKDQDYINFVNQFDARIAMTPDLNYEWFNGYFIPHAIDTHKYDYCWNNGKIISHSPSTSSRKGTDCFLEALKQIENFKDWKFDLIQNVSHSECIRRKREATLFFDQAGREAIEKLGIDDIIGFYGNSAIEAMVYGIPTIAHISQHALEGIKRAGKDWSSCPILNTSTDIDGMRKVVQSFVDMSFDEKQALSRKTRKWIEEHHSFQATAIELAKVYGSLLSKKV